jgi:anti-sigma factor RsiW
MKDQLPTEIADLHAYVDDQLSPESRRRVEDGLASRPEARRQAADYALIREGLRALYAPVLQEPVPARLLRPETPRRWLRPLGAVAAGVFLMLAGTWVGMHLERGDTAFLAGVPDTVREAAMAYAVYAPEVRHPVEVPGDQEQHLVSWLTKRMGVQVRAPDLANAGFRLLGGRLLSSTDGPGALLMYENHEGKRVVLYACPSEEGERDTAFRFAQDEGVSVFYWSEGGLSYALAGEIERAGLLRLTEAAYQQIAI